MELNEWGAIPGTQDNLLPEDAPMLSERECTLVNLYRAIPEDGGKEMIKLLYEVAAKYFDVTHGESK